MFRQTFVLVSVMFAVWGMGVAGLALHSGASVDTSATMGNAHGARYQVNTRTTRAYQDPTGRFTVYVRASLRDQDDAVEREWR